jgi:hypothetical protein
MSASPSTMRSNPYDEHQDTMSTLDVLYYLPNVCYLS